MRLFFVGLMLILAGFFLVLIAPLLALASNAKVAATGGAVGCVVIFFVPICFGTGSPGLLTWSLLAASVLLAVSAFFLWLISRELDKGEEQGR